MSIKVKAKCLKCKYNNGDFRIFSWSPIGQYNDLKLSSYFNFSTKGKDAYITEGKEYDLILEEISSTEKYGGTYKIISVPSLGQIEFDKLNREESFAILRECTTSDRIANNILDAIPNFIQKIIEEGKESIDTSLIKGVGEAYLNAYTRNLLTKYKYIGVMNQFKDWGVDIDDCKSLIEEYKDSYHIEEAFKNTPYKVNIESLGKGFEKADKQIIELRPDLRISEQRCAYLISDVLDKNEEDGDSKLDANSLYNYIMNEYTQASELEPLIVSVAMKNELFHYDEEEISIAKMSTYCGEMAIAEFVKSKLKPNVWDIDYTKYTEIRDGKLTEEQSEVLKAVCENNFVINDSKGGTGKTSSTMALIEMLEDNDISYRMVAPTGVVAKRLKELTNRNASTIHMACLTTEAFYEDVIIIEEGSMIGIDLLCMLINHIGNPNIKILVNMDLGQIAPISCGCPMRDIIRSGLVKVCNLTKVFRYGEGGMSKMATDAYDKNFYIQDFFNEDRKVIGKNNDYTYIKYNGSISQIIDEYKELYERGIKPIDIAVITPWNITDFGCINLSNEIQKIVNPDIIEGKFIETTVRKQKVLFKVGDIILNTKNNYSVMSLEVYKRIKSSGILTKEDIDKKELLTCMNGEIGKIINIDGNNIIAQFDENIIVIDKPMQRNLMLGYAMTSYKLQGSERAYTITLITPQFKDNLNKNIIYTDLSRARVAVKEIIDPQTLYDTIGIDITEKRLTNLGKLLLDIKNEMKYNVEKEEDDNVV